MLVQRASWRRWREPGWEDEEEGGSFCDGEGRGSWAPSTSRPAPRVGCDGAFVSQSLRVAPLHLAPNPAGKPSNRESECSVPGASSALCASSRTDWNLLPPPHCRAEHSQAPFPDPLRAAPLSAPRSAYSRAHPAPACSLRGLGRGRRAACLGLSGPLRQLSAGWALCPQPLASASPRPARPLPLGGLGTLQPVGPRAPRVPSGPQSLGNAKPRLPFHPPIPKCPVPAGPSGRISAVAARSHGREHNSQRQCSCQIQCLFHQIHFPLGMAFCFSWSVTSWDWEFLQGRSGVCPAPSWPLPPSAGPGTSLALREEMNE